MNNRPSSSSSDKVLVACPVCDTAHLVELDTIPDTADPRALCPRCRALAYPDGEPAPAPHRPARQLRAVADELEAIANEAGKSSPLFTLAALDAGKLRAIADLEDRGEADIYPGAWLDGGRAMVASYRRAIAQQGIEATA